MKIFNTFFFSFLCLVGITTAQYEDIIMEDYIYVTNIKSVEFYPSGDPIGPPVVSLGNSQKMVLSFDDMDNEQKEFSYEIVHCNKDWTAFTQIERLEYSFGFQNEELDNANYSENTFVPYLNYQLILPNEDLQWTISGNYLLIIYEGMDPDDRIPVITRRFLVANNKVNVQVNSRRPLDVMKLRTHHEFDLFIENEEFPILDPKNNMYVTVMQNNNWSTALENINPKFFVGNRMTIDNAGLISFPANKEYRAFDIRSLDVTGIGVRSIDLNAYGTDVLLDLGLRRRDSYYTFEPDANGQFVIQNRDIPVGSSQGSFNAESLASNFENSTSNVSRLRGDYGKVIFTLQSEKLDEEVYVMGKFTDWKPDEMYRMRYYDEKEVYVAEILLKQGYYNYFYAVDDDGFLDPTPIEGNWADTENSYHVFVYLQEPGERYDQLIGYYSFNSNDFDR